MSEPVRFFLDCGDDQHHFYVVEVYETRAAMQRAMDKLDAPRGSKQALAVTLRYKADYRTKQGRLRLSPELGTLFFTRGEMAPDVVVHELTHAAIGWARRRRINPMKQTRRYSSCPEEKLAHTMQTLFTQFYAEAAKCLTPVILKEAA